ncbi:ABC transporter permease [Akkermansiaceae bacterium]|nr:ABC transporter permease [Akkermansiaceae bacterium]
MMSKLLNNWFKVREDLSPSKRALLTFMSFFLPFLIWAVAAYTPGLWDVSYNVETTTDLKSEKYSTIYRTDFIMEKEQFEGFQDMVREKNTAIGAYLADQAEIPEGIKVSTRSNKKVLRKIAPIAISDGILKEDQSTDDAALYAIWLKLADGSITFPEITPENIAIIQQNAEILKAASGESYVSDSFPSEPLYHLIPVGAKAVGRPSYLPAPHECYEAAVKLFKNTEDPISARYFASIQIVFYGFLVAVIIGIPLGLLAGTFDFFSRLFEPFTDFFRYLPAPAFGTLLVFLLGSHDAPKVALVFLGTVCQALLMTANTARQLDKGILDAAQTLGANKASLVFKVVIPGISHNLYNDLRILLGWAWTWLVIAELMGVKSGLTEIIDTQGRRFNFDIVYAVILSIGVTGFLTDQLLQKLYPVFFPWAAEAKSSVLKRMFDKLRQPKTPVKTT